MAPLLRRTWSPCGQTPICSHRTRAHQKVSAIAALAIRPDRKRVRLYFRLHPDANINAPLIVSFLYHLLKQLHAPVMLVWDRLLAHRARKVQDFVYKHSDLHVSLLPPYAPELDPVEQVWGYLKFNPLANFAPRDLASLTSAARRHARSLQYAQSNLRSFIQHCPLPLHLN